MTEVGTSRQSENKTVDGGGCGGCGRGTLGAILSASQNGDFATPPLSLPGNQISGSTIRIPKSSHLRGGSLAPVTCFFLPESLEAQRSRN